MIYNHYLLHLYAQLAPRKEDREKRSGIDAAFEDLQFLSWFQHSNQRHFYVADQNHRNSLIYEQRLDDLARVSITNRRRAIAVWRLRGCATSSSNNERVGPLSLHRTIFIFSFMVNADHYLIIIYYNRFYLTLRNCWMLLPDLEMALSDVTWNARWRSLIEPKNLRNHEKKRRRWTLRNSFCMGELFRRAQSSRLIIVIEIYTRNIAE